MFSVIVVCLNAEKTIKSTLNSILCQTFKDYEIIIKDGVSKDNTIKLIPEDKRIHTIINTDSSVYDAMNQALNYANGQYIIFMNCGDTFYDSGVLERIYDQIVVNQLEGMEVIYGDYIKNQKEYKQTPIIDRKYMINGGLCHQTVFFGRKVFEEYGNFDVNFRICADYEIMARVLANNVRYIHINIPICNYLGGGISEKAENINLVKKEGKLVRQRYFNRIERTLYYLRKIVRKLGSIKREE